MRLEYFQMIDRVVALDLAQGTIASKATVPAESPVFEGHFPGFPIMPGVLLLETMAQASGYLLLAKNGLTRMPFFAGVKQGKFRSFVPPGTALDVTAHLIHEGSGFAVTGAMISVDGKRASDCEITFRLVPFPSATFEATMRAQVERIGLFAAAGA